MNLLIDVGNTRLKWGCENKGKIEEFGFLASAGLSRSALDESMASISKPKAVWISSVVSSSNHKVLIEWLLQRYQITPKVVKVRQSVIGFSNDYSDLDALGVDRWVAAIGARACVQAEENVQEDVIIKDIIIVDAGTAITIDCLSSKNVFLGGVIYPGSRLMHDSLVGGTSGINSEFFETDQIIGKTTSECVNSGIAFGVVGAVERIVSEMRDIIGATTQIVITGGGAQGLLSRVQFDALYEPNLVLHGLRRIAALQANNIVGHAECSHAQSVEPKNRPLNRDSIKGDS